jgi:hypothetical protein
VPVAFFGAPSGEAEVEPEAVPGAEAELVVPPLGALLLVLELLEPQAAARSPVTATAATEPNHRVDFI